MLENLNVWKIKLCNFEEEKKLANMSCTILYQHILSNSYHTGVLIGPFRYALILKPFKTGLEFKGVSWS